MEDIKPKKNFFGKIYKKLALDWRDKINKKVPWFSKKVQRNQSIIFSLSIKIQRTIGRLATREAQKHPYPEKTVLDYDWDYLIVIDACRHDLFEEVYGKSNYIISQGSCTLEWRDRTFRDGSYDLVYVSANPLISEVQMKKKMGKVPFFHLEKTYLDGWDKQLKTVPPGEVTEAALGCHEKWPDKRMIIHYIQPHHPFIGKNKIIVDGMSKGEGIFGIGEDPWLVLARGELSEKKVWKAYKDNLKLVMGEANKLKEKFDGKIVLTSDHGNCIGEYGIYGHPYEVRIPELVKVPYVELGKGE